jgi:hypothetical protein
LAKEQNIKQASTSFKNDDTSKQLLTRTVYIIAKKKKICSRLKVKKIEPKLLFAHYPLLEQSSKHSMEFRNIYESTPKVEAKK